MKVSSKALLCSTRSTLALKKAELESMCKYSQPTVIVPTLTVNQIYAGIATLPMELRTINYSFFIWEDSKFGDHPGHLWQRAELIPLLYNQCSPKFIFQWRPTLYNLLPKALNLFDARISLLSPELFDKFLDVWCAEQTLHFFAKQTHGYNLDPYVDYAYAPVKYLMQKMKRCKVNFELRKGALEDNSFIRHLRCVKRVVEILKQAPRLEGVETVVTWIVDKDYYDGLGLGGSNPKWNAEVVALLRGWLVPLDVLP
jgi:hypothetical protein